MKGSTVLLFAVLLLVASATQLNDIFVKVRPLREKQLNEKFLSTLTRAERRQAVYDELTSIARISQAGLISDLKKTSVEFRSFWISNSIYIQGVSDSFVSLLKSRPDVIEVHKEHFAKLIESVDVVENKERLEAPGWNLEAINVPSAWNVTSGEGIVVANIDTGVRYTHEALVGNYRGANDNGTFSHDYNWFDLKGSTSPSDGNGHGTHTMGSIVGSKDSGVGVAPGSKWIAAQGCRTILCSEADLTGSAEFVLCPTKLDGTEPDCSRGADVVSNSWGGGQGDDWYTSYVEAWRDAGIIPVFAQGNSGPQCETANSPGDLASVIGVGATDNGNALARFSSRGPSVNGNLPFTEIKPDISAPGAAVRSCSNRGDSTYASMSGTSMACPHIAGVVALILSANPSATYDQVYEALTSTASHDIDAPNGGAENCGGLNYDEFPNNHYGHGLADALAAVEAI